MYKKEEIVIISSPVTYLRYTLTNNINVKVYQYDNILQKDVLELQKVFSLSISLFNTQYAVDVDKSCIYIAPSLIGKHIRIEYYSEGAQNPFYASSNLHKFITQVLKWTSNRISEGLYLHWQKCDPAYMRIINEGSVIYENRFIVYPGGVFDIRQQSPPTIKGTYKAYKIFINLEIIQSFMDKQTQMLSKIGILSSSVAHPSIDKAKLDVMTRYTTLYESEALVICYVYIMLREDYGYELYVEYPPEYRTLV